MILEINESSEEISEDTAEYTTEDSTGSSFGDDPVESEITTEIIYNDVIATVTDSEYDHNMYLSTGTYSDGSMDSNNQLLLSIRNVLLLILFVLIIGYCHLLFKNTIRKFMR